ncbi:MAG: ABC transporter permease [Acidobacteriaceae bacterium]
MDALRRDLVTTFRRLSKSPTVVLSVVLSIGLGIGANATIFSMVSRFVLRPAPVGEPGTLLALNTTEAGERCCNEFPWPVYTDVRDGAKSFSGVAAYYDLLPASMGGSGEPARVWGQAATANYFDVAQIPLTLGRGFLPGEEKQRVIVLGYRLWRRRFASDPAIVGKDVTLSGKPFTVVGVAPPAFHGIDQILDPQFWIPLGIVEQFAPGLPDRNLRSQHWLSVIARLKPGLTEGQAKAELATLAKHYAAAYPATDKDIGFRLEQAGSLPPRDRATVLLFLSALSVVVLLVLGIACANVSNLLLAWAAARKREMAVRLALGAGRAVLLRQMLLESVVLALGGGLVGAALSLWATSALGAFHVPAPVPLDLSLRLDWRVLLYTLALSIGAGLFFAAVPAWIATHPRLTDALRGEDALARPGRRLTLRNLLVVSQIAMCVVLLCAAGLFLRSLSSATNIDIGFRSRGVVMLSVDPRIHGYTPAATTRFLEDVRERIGAIPGVTAAAVTDVVPLSGGNRSDGFTVEGRKSTSEPPIVDEYMAGPGYFAALGIPRIAGRDFSHEAAGDPKAAIVSESFATRLFGRENPIGQRVSGGGATYEIIGVVGDIKSRTLGEDTRPVLFRSLAQNVGSDPSFLGYTIVVRSAGDTAAIVGAARQAIHAIDPAMAVYNVETIEEHLRSALFLPSLAGTLFGIFGGIGLALAGIGLYGVMSYTVSRRRREIGIRIALGAQRTAIQRLMLGQGLRLMLIALAVGLPVAWMLAKFSGSFLYGIRPHDAFTFTAVPVFLAGIGMLACWIPSRRAAEVDPQTTLRSE